MFGKEVEGMKLLGKFRTSVGNQCIDLLREGKIDVSIEDVYEEELREPFMKGQPTVTVHYIKLFVGDDDFDDAERIVKTFSMEQIERFGVVSKSADRAMLNFFIGFICAIGLTIFIFWCRDNNIRSSKAYFNNGGCS
jgi:hypothetical protein